MRDPCMPRGRPRTPCNYPANTCLRHGPPAASIASSTESPEAAPERSLRELTGQPATGADGRPLQFNPVRFAQDALKGILYGRTRPEVGLRIIRALESLHRIGPTEDDRSEQLHEMAVIGSIMNGIPPTTTRDWEIAKRIYEPGMIEQMRRWVPSPGWQGVENLDRSQQTVPVYNALGSGDPDIWGEKAIDYDKYPEPPDHEVPEFFNPYLPEYNAIREK